MGYISRIAIAIALGIAFGIATDNVLSGLVFGVGLGVIVIFAMMKQRNTRADDG